MGALHVTSPVQCDVIGLISGGMMSEDGSNWVSYTALVTRDVTRAVPRRHRAQTFAARRRRALVGD